MVIKYGLPPTEQESRQFRYQHLDIYKRFFKKISKKDKYIPQRLHHNSKEFTVTKDPNTIKIFIIGGSVGWNFGFYPFENTLKDLIPDKNFEVICCGMGAYDSYRDYLVEKEILSYEPNLIIVFSGNNEFYNKIKINLWSHYLNKILSKFWTYRRLQNWFLNWQAERGLIYFRNKKERIQNYEKNIRLIVKKAKSKGVPIILCTLPVNFRDCPPNGKRPLDKRYLLAHFLFEQGDYSNAVEEFKKFLKDNPDNAFGYYFLARTYDATKNYPKAKSYYLRSLELNYTYDDRASPGSNEIIRQICSEEGVGLADLELAFMNLTPHSLLGREQFFDNCHWYMEYNSLVAEVILQAISQNNKLCFRITDFNSAKLGSSLFYHNFLSLKERGRRKDEVDGRIKNAVWEVLGLGNDGLSERAISYFETVYLMNPDSLWAMSSSKDKIKKMLSEDFWTEEYIVNFEKHWPKILYYTGEAYRRRGLYKEALSYFDEVILLDKDNHLPHIGRTLVYHALRDRYKASENINRAEQISDNLEVKYYKEILGL